MLKNQFPERVLPTAGFHSFFGTNSNEIGLKNDSTRANRVRTGTAFIFKMYLLTTVS